MRRVASAVLGRREADALLEVRPERQRRGEAAGRSDLFDAVTTGFEQLPRLPDAFLDQPLLRSLRRLLRPCGMLLNLVSAPDLYLHEWTSSSACAFAGNRAARCGDTVRISLRDRVDASPVIDIFCDDAEYRALYAQAGMEVIDTHRPRGRASDPFPWISEAHIAPWVIYLLRHRPQSERGHPLPSVSQAAAEQQSRGSNGALSGINLR
jgi:hypothetical protein